MVSGQSDLYEGVVYTIKENQEVLEPDLNNHLNSDIFLRAKGFGYCNVLSFYRLDYMLINKYGYFPFVEYNLNDKMKDFGEYVVIIDDEEKLLKRIGKAAEEQNYKYLCGNVRYRDYIKDGIIAPEKNTITIKLDGEIDIDFVNQYKNAEKKRNCFDKMSDYTYQNEWRTVLYRVVQSVDAYRLEIGNIRDICHWVKSEDIIEALDEDFKKGVKTGTSGYYGNVSKTELRDLFNKLGNNKAEMIGIIG